MLAEGNALATTLIRGFHAFAHDPKLHLGPQTSAVAFQSVPDAKFTIADNMNAQAGAALAKKYLNNLSANNIVANIAQQHISSQQVGTPSNPIFGLPRPASPSMQISVGENMQITPAEDDRLHTEMMLLGERVRNAIDSMQCGRWMRMQEAKARVGDW